ncbi:hypothetical protein [Actinomyces vulturis]|uniref:hypothetical protein n=1 Tax=Actinomyces vulturis TaxID=1857645 RepID=UPI001146D6E8|nr:hypothetical protein [Actinomyces vulturis]
MFYHQEASDAAAEIPTHIDGRPLTRRERRALERAAEKAALEAQNNDDAIVTDDLRDAVTPALPSSQQDTSKDTVHKEFSDVNTTEDGRSHDQQSHTEELNEQASEASKSVDIAAVEDSENTGETQCATPCVDTSNVGNADGDAPAESLDTEVTNPVPDVLDGQQFIEAVEPDEHPIDVVPKDVEYDESSRVINEPSPLTGPQRVIVATLHRPRPRGRRAMVLAGILAVLIMVIPVAITRITHEARPGVQDIVSPPPTGVLADSPLHDIIHVAGRLGATPVVQIDSPLLPTEGVLSDELIHGEGPALQAGKPALLSVSTFSGTDGANTTGTETGTRLYVGLLEPSIIGDELAKRLEGVNQGSRIILRAPATAGQEGGEATEEEITIVDVLPLQADGEAQDPLPGMPPLVFNPDGTVTANLSGVAPPTKALASTVIKGEGEQVKDTSTIVARYALISWNTGAVISSSWGNDVLPSVIEVSGTMTGVAQHLIDVTVGSRVLMALPPDQARGDEPVFVVMDVLAIDHTKDAGATVKPSSDTDEVVVVTPTPTPLAQPETTQAPIP